MSSTNQRVWYLVEPSRKLLPPPRFFSQPESTPEADLRQLHSSSQQLVASYNQLVELSHVLQKCDDIFSEAKASYTASHEEVLQPSSSADDLAAMALEGQQELEAFAPLQRALLPAGAPAPLPSHLEALRARLGGRLASRPKTCEALERAVAAVARPAPPLRAPASLALPSPGGRGDAPIDEAPDPAPPNAALPLPSLGSQRQQWLRLSLSRVDCAPEALGAPPEAVSLVVSLVREVRQRSGSTSPGSAASDTPRGGSASATPAGSGASATATATTTPTDASKKPCGEARTAVGGTPARRSRLRAVTPAPVLCGEPLPCSSSSSLQFHRAWSAPADAASGDALLILMLEKNEEVIH